MGFPRFLALQQLHNCPNIFISNCRLQGTQQKSHRLWKCNPSKKQALGLTATHQKSTQGFLGTLVKRLNPKLLLQQLSWALNGPIWLGTIVSVLAQKYTFSHTKMLIILLLSSQQAVNTSTFLQIYSRCS